MKAYTRRRLLAAVKLGLAAVPLWAVVTLLEGRPLNGGTFVLAFGLGFSVGIAELFVLRNWRKGLPFLAHLGMKSVAIAMVIFLVYAVLNLLDVVFADIGWQRYVETLFDPQILVGLAEALGVIAILLFFSQLDRLLGPGVLFGYMTGRYHRPRREARIFLFLDLKGSTALADGMDAERYFGFLHQYFTVMSEPILETNAAIYQYVGDEVVLTWPMDRGLEEANCLRVFFLIEQQIHAHSERFLREFGVVPAFKAGVHAGDVITAQIGELKSEIVHNGDVLNTTARIQAMCNALGHRLLVSAELIERLSPGPEYLVEALGPLPIRGKGEAMGICAVRRAGVPSERGRGAGSADLAAAVSPDDRHSANRPVPPDPRCECLAGLPVHQSVR